MLHFFYDSLDTLKKVKKPTWKEVRVFTVQVFAVVLVSACIFFVLDTLRGNLYQQIFYSFGAPTSSSAQSGANIEVPLIVPQAPTEDKVIEWEQTPPTEEVQEPVLPVQVAPVPEA